MRAGYAALCCLLASADAQDFDQNNCPPYLEAYNYAKQLQGWRGAATLKQTWDALGLTTECGYTFPDDEASLPMRPPRGADIPPNALVMYVDAELGADSPGRGAAASPFRTLNATVMEIRRVRREQNAMSRPAVVLLAGGMHRLADTLALTDEDSYLTITAADDKAPVISGAQTLTTKWEVHDREKGIYKTSLKGQVNEVKALRVGQARGFAAAYPNRNPELTLFPDGWVKDGVSSWGRPNQRTATYLTLDKPIDPVVADKTMYSHYTVGIGGNCDIFSPPVSYWCSDKFAGGAASPFTLPTSMTVPRSSLPLKNYTAQSAREGRMHVWRPSHWASWWFQFDQFDAEEQKFSWTKGGFQGARGSKKGAEWYIENLFEELDDANEFYFDNATKDLYYVLNATAGAGIDDLHFSAVNLFTLISHVGDFNSKKPVKNVTIQGVTIRDTAMTVLEPHGVPSGGDWALERMGAVFYETTENCRFVGNNMTKVDGNGVFISGYARGFYAGKNEFSWIGATVMAAWGYTAPLGGDHGDSVLAQYKVGVDGRAGEHPRDCVIEDNYIRELGHFIKQCSPWFQAKTYGTVLRRNIGFNMPRAGFNFNDGFGGGAEIVNNLLFNTCRESGDHAAFNSWDRQPFIVPYDSDSAETNGFPPMDPQYTRIHHNFLVGSYGAINTVDNDDGSSFYEIDHNVLMRGGHKSNFGGHNKLSHHNINLYTMMWDDGCCVRDESLNVPSARDSYHDNHCVQEHDGTVMYWFKQCVPGQLHNASVTSTLHSYNNTISNPAGKNFTVLCGNDKDTATQYSESEWQKFGFDLGTVTGKNPSVDELMQEVRDILGL
eukprot:TRINITY_DN6337_c0_g3_i1.p1 TRINITY_DN6337_c0_g3~~TRINITY_DN6337_c0_g3_i1.p1  ORF type:complete len:833 (+),score=239.87 TRINITY_DN6337_c0_g3_i1:54-2552(+)